MIVAVDNNFAIGKGNAMPWHLPADFAHFKETTLGHPVIVGYNTFLSIGRPLPGRTNVVLTEKEEIDGCVVAHSLEEAFKLAQKEDDDVYVIGGASVYEQALPFADRLVVTKVRTEVHGADAFFPWFDPQVWEEVSREDRPSDEKNEFDMTFVIYERKK
jgi:dihydrofolate reductase